MHSGRILTEEIPCSVVSCSCLWNLVVGLRLHSVDKIGELHGILKEEDRDIVADNIWEGYTLVTGDHPGKTIFDG